MYFKRFILIALFTSTTIVAQKKNAFLDRAYWKKNPSIEEIDAKIKAGNDIAALNRFAFDAVSWALIEKVDNATVKYLLSKKGNDVNKITHDGRTYIFWAAYKGNLEMMQYLVDKGAKTDIIDSHGYSLLNFAATTGQLDTALYDFCIAHGADPKKEKSHDGANALLLVAPFIKDIALIDYFTAKGVAINTTDKYGNGIFNYAAKTGNISLMKYLVKKGISYKNKNTNGGNAMIFASKGTRNKTNSLDVFQYLEQLGISPNVVTKKGVTPLHVIAYKGKDLSIFNYFISKGVNLNQADEHGNTVFLNAVRSNDLSIIEFLASKIEDINVSNKEGVSPLLIAVQRNTPEVVTFLLSKGANIHVKDKKGHRLNYYLLKSYSPQKSDAFKRKVTLLSQQGIDFTKAQDNGDTLYHLALDYGDIALLKWVHSLGIDINAKNTLGLTPLQKAAMTAKDAKILKYLLSIGADKTIKTSFDETVYHLASENELLQKHHINIQFLK
jgi:ankyrin repeat protein